MVSLNLAHPVDAYLAHYTDTTKQLDISC